MTMLPDLTEAGRCTTVIVKAVHELNTGQSQLECINRRSCGQQFVNDIHQRELNERMWITSRLTV